MSEDESAAAIQNRPAVQVSNFRAKKDLYVHISMLLICIFLYFCSASQNLRLIRSTVEGSSTGACKHFWKPTRPHAPSYGNTHCGGQSKYYYLLGAFRRARFLARGTLKGLPNACWGCWGMAPILRPALPILQPNHPTKEFQGCSPQTGRSRSWCTSHTGTLGLECWVAICWGGRRAARA